MRAYLPYIFTLIIGPLVGYVIYKWRAAIDLESQRAQAALRGEQAPIEVMRSALDRRDKEVAEARAQLYAFMNNHLVHDKEEREALVKVLSGIQVEQRANVETLKEINLEIKSHREEEARRTAAIHTKLDAIHLDVVKDQS